MATSRLRTQLKVEEMFHKHGPAPVSEKGGNESCYAEEMQALYTLTQSPYTHTHTPQKKQTSGLTFSVRFEVAVYGRRLAFGYVHRSTRWGFGAGAEAHVGWRGHLFSEGGELHCARSHGHIVGLLDGF